MKREYPANPPMTACEHALPVGDAVIVLGCVALFLLSLFLVSRDLIGRLACTLVATDPRVRLLPHVAPIRAR